MIEPFSGIGFRETLDIGFVALFFYAVIIWTKRARASFALVGILILAGIYVLTQVLSLQLTAWIFQGFFAVFLMMLVVIFQKDLRRLFESIALRSFHRNQVQSPSDETLEALASALTELSLRHHGALVVVRAKDPIERHTEGGFHLDGRLSFPLLLSLFDPHSLGHDGAVILEGDRISRFSVQLPLSRDFHQLGHRGTRHSAALGLAERTDALCLVVSEERGQISIAIDGTLRHVADPDDLLAELRKFLAARNSFWNRGSRSRFHVLRKNWREKMLALAVAFGLWVVFVSGSEGARELYQFPVRLDNVPPGFEVSNVVPKEVEVTLSGPRRDFYFLDKTKLEVRLDVYAIAYGRSTYQIADQDVRRPPSLTVLQVKPPAVDLTVKRLKGDGKVSRMNQIPVPGPWAVFRPASLEIFP